MITQKKLLIFKTEAEMKLLRIKAERAKQEAKK